MPPRAHDLPLRTSRDVYEPAEDSWLLADEVLARDLAGRRALDVGTGTGLSAIAAALRGAEVVATDVNPAACALARENAAQNGVRVEVVRADLARGICGAFDLVTFNAPYLPSEPEERLEGWIDAAFHGGEGGVEVARRLVADLPRLLAPGGVALVVASSRGDLGALAAEAEAAALESREAGEARFFFERVVLLEFRRRNNA